MANPRSDWIWRNGTLVPWDDAKIHLGSHVIHYGSAVFEGIRCYKTPKGPAVFRLDAHTERLFDSAKIYRMDLGYTREQLNDAILETIRANELDACYVRPIVYRGVRPARRLPARLAGRGRRDGLGLGQVPGPGGARAGRRRLRQLLDAHGAQHAAGDGQGAGNYLNSQLIKMEAVKGGFAEGIALDASGYVSEGCGENLFPVVKGKLVTPPLVSSILPGITRDSVLALAKRLGIEIQEKALPREMLYLADELFFTGTAAEITPIRSVDRHQVGARQARPGHRGAAEGLLRRHRVPTADEHGWLTFVPALVAAASGAGAVGPGAGRAMHINDLLKIASERKASDLHLKVGSHPVLRINGELIPLVETKRLMQEDTIAMAFSIMSARQKQKFKDNFEIDIAYSVPGLGRFRCNVFQQRGTVGLVLRVIPVKIMTVRELGLPVVLEQISQRAARADPVHRHHRLGQVDDARRDDRLHQRPALRAHHHDRGPDRVPAPRQEVDRQPARGRGRHPELRRRAARARCARTPT